LSIAQEQGIAIVARQPFASGRLFRGSDEPVEQTVLKHYQRLAQQWDRSLAHLALQFVAQIEGVSVVIAGANTPAHLADNVHALQSKSLTPEQMTQLTQTQPAPLS
jgi:aryl-alcohol dehydrogenase-like predicted oxidoreductase